MHLGTLYTVGHLPRRLTGRTSGGSDRQTDDKEQSLPHEQSCDITGGGGGNRDVSVDDVMTPGAIFVDSRLSYCF